MLLGRVNCRVGNGKQHSKEDACAPGEVQHGDRLVNEDCCGQNRKERHESEGWGDSGGADEVDGQVENPWAKTDEASPR